jgi:hypothetical protein
MANEGKENYLVSDEQIKDRIKSYTIPYQREIFRNVKEFREIYEAERAKLLADKASLEKQLETAKKHLAQFVELNKEKNALESLSERKSNF